MEDIRQLIENAKEAIIPVEEEEKMMDNLGMTRGERINSWMSVIKEQDEYFKLLQEELKHLKLIPEEEIEEDTKEQISMTVVINQPLNGVKKFHIPAPGQLKKYLKGAINLKQDPLKFSFLPERNELDFKPRMMQALSYVRQEMKELEEFRHADRAEFAEDLSLVADYEETYGYLQNVLTVLREYMQPKIEVKEVKEEKKDVEDTKRKVVFLQRSSGTYFESEMNAGEMNGQGRDIHRCLNDFVNGGPIYKGLVTIDMEELRYNDIRVFVTQWENGTYIINGVYLKKAACDKKYLQYIMSRDKEVKRQLGILAMQKEENPNFMQEQNLILEKINQTLSEKMSGKGYVKK